MNKQLFDSFKSLDELARAGMQKSLHDSPVGLKLFDFLEKCGNRNFRNSEVVEFVYRGEKDKAEYRVLENRFFKLRKKFMEEFLREGTDDTEELLTEEERELMRCRQLIRQNEKDAAGQALSRLEKECREKNIFELLPQVIDNLIFCNQLLNKLDKNAGLYRRMEEAIELQAEMYRVISLARTIYEINFRKGISHAKKELNALKQISLKYREHPRFALCYHHIALYYKLGSSDYIEDMQVISRHYGQLRQLMRKFPRLPLISYRKNYILHQQMHYRQMAVFYHYNRCEFTGAYRVMKEFCDLIFARPGIYGMYRSESVYFNMFNCCRATLRFSEAAQTVDDYISFLKENRNSEKLAYAYTLKAILHADSLSAKDDQETAFLIKKLDEYMRRIKGDSNVQTSFGDALVIKSRLLFLQKKFSLALEIIIRREALNYLEDLSIKDLYLDFYGLFVKENHRIVPAGAFRKELSKGIVLAKKPVALMHLKWMERIFASRLSASQKG